MYRLGKSEGSDNTGGDAPTSPFSSSTTLTHQAPLSEKTALEPQNPLTRQFTEAEWVALRKLRVSRL